MRMTTIVRVAAGCIALCVAGTASQAWGDVYADVVIDYSPVIVNGQPTEPHRGAENSLHAPDYGGDNSCASADACTFVSLGDGGSLTLRFADNALTGSDNSDPDIWIYEVGPDVEDTFVDISTDNVTWISVGKVFGSTSTIDIDAFGYGKTSTFSYIRLTDDTNEGGQSGNTVGADIDAVEALSSTPVPVEPTTWGTIKGLWYR